MKLSLDWLSDFVDVPPLGALVERLTFAGIEVEGVHGVPAETEGVVVGEVLTVVPHPKSDHLKVCVVNDGTNEHKVVCGAANVAPGQRVPLARVGARLGTMQIERRVLRGVESAGMIASRAELGLEAQSDGIWVLPAKAPLGTPIFEAVRAGTTVELSITPNRADLLSHIGIAREVGAAFGTRVKSPNWRLPENGPEAGSLARVLVDESSRCRRYQARIVQNLHVGPSPEWLRERLVQIGQRPINNVVDATNYVLFELGQPLHAFDLAKITGDGGLPTIRVRLARPGESIVTLDDVERALDADDLVIADAARPIAIAGVMGGSSSEVSESTTTVLLESAVFDPTSVRRTARRFGLHSEASHRFERGVDVGGVARAVDRCAQLLAEIAGGVVAKGRIDVAQKPEPPREVSLRLERLARIVGVELGAEQVVQLLDPLGVRCVSRNDTSLRFEVPTYRGDIVREIDVIEEVVRRYGYDKVPERLPDAGGDYATAPRADTRLERVRTTLLDAGVSEAVTYGFGKPTHYDMLALREGEPLRLLNPLGEDLSALRTSLLPGLLLCVGHNQRLGEKHIRLFEAGTTFHRRDPDPDDEARDRDLPRESKRLAVVLCGGRAVGRWYEKGEDVGFGDLAGIAEGVLQALELGDVVRRVPSVILGLHPHAGALIQVGEQSVGWLGELHPQWLRHYDLSGPVMAMELEMDVLASLAQRRRTFASLPRFPGTRRDVALLAPVSTSADSIRAFVAAYAGGDLGPGVVEQVRLFDVYQGKPVPDGQVSLAFAVDYRHPERTLTDAEVGSAFAGLLSRLEADLHVEVRR